MEFKKDRDIVRWRQRKMEGGKDRDNKRYIHKGSENDTVES